LKNWEKLTAATRKDLDDDPNLRMDYDELQVETYRNYNPMFADGIEIT
jgi:trans-2-enoyl-CoA reductase